MLMVGAMWVCGYVALPACPFAAWLSLLCPMCGTTRAIEAVLSGDLVQAFRLNPIFPVWMATVLVVWSDTLWVALFDSSSNRPILRALRAAMRSRAFLVLSSLLLLGVAGYLNLVMRAELLG